jgi:CheY-like chemotaxis protein
MAMAIRSNDEVVGDAQTRANWLLYIGLGALAVVVFGVDLATPLGVAVWILYVVPLGLTLLGTIPIAPVIGAVGCTLLMLVTLTVDRAVVEPWVAYVNRVCGIVVIWTIALLARNLIQNRNRLQAEDWIRRTRTRLLEGIQGELALAEIGERALSIVAPALGSPVSALYAHDGSVLRLVATRGLRSGADVPETFEMGAGLVGEAGRSRHPTVLTDLPGSFFAIRSALGDVLPRHLIVAPVVADGRTEGVIELGFVGLPGPRALDLLDRTQHAVAVAIRTAFYRDRLRALLAETQRQAEILTEQQERLRSVNVELEQQSLVLQASQAKLEEQQAELEATNAELEAQTETLEQQKQALTQSQQEAERASQYKSEFLANMSHELRTPLNSTLILARLLAENKDGRLSDDQVRYAETIYASGNTLLALINDILDLSKIEAGAVELHVEAVAPRDVAEATHRAFEPIAREKKLDLRVDVTQETPSTIETDGSRVQQILMNLVSNAIKFTEQGSVVLRVGPAASGRIAFEVRDTGIGISADKQQVIFEAFRQADGSTHRRYGGTGLGLSISLELARLLGGSLHVTSAAGAGSTFTLMIPIQHGSQPSAERRRPRILSNRREAPTLGGELRSGGSALARGTVPPAAGAKVVEDDRSHQTHPGRLILVVEDDVNFARILLDLAHELDFDCVIATTNAEGFALATELSPIGILLDVELPDGSGLTLLDRLKRNTATRHIPVHMISVGDYTQTALALGAVGYAVKPASREDLVKAIRRLEARLEQRVRRVLVVEDDTPLRDSIEDLLRLDGVAIHAVGTAREALELVAAQSFDCIVLDLNLPDASGYDVLEKMSHSEQYSFPPVIVYTGKALSADDEARLRRYSRSVILKGARSPERLLDEVTLFLHEVESRLPPDSRRMLRTALERDDLFANRTILLVEDDVRNVFALTSVFEPRGARVVVARNGREGIEQAEAAKPDLVLMDIMMPEMDGLAATRAIRARQGLRDVPIIALTAKATRDDYKQCLSAGCSDYLAKPLDVDRLVSLCRVWLSR